MNKLFLALLVIAAAPSLSFAKDKEIITQSYTTVLDVIPSAEKPELLIPARINVHTMTQANVLITHDSSGVFSITLTASTNSDTDENKMAKSNADLQKFLQNVSFKYANDGGLEVKAKDSGGYFCSFSSSNDVYTSLKGTCLSTITVNLPTDMDIPVTYSR